MANKKSKFYSIFRFKCPHCHEGNFFEGNPFKGTVKEKCPVCERKYSIEPGFYQGSYYVVYALSVAVFVTIWTSINLFFDDVSFDTTIYAILIGLVVTAPINYPLSKIIWANFFLKYKGRNKVKND